MLSDTFPGRSYRWTHARPSGVENATPSVEMHPNPEPVVENATPSLEMQLKMQPLRLNLARRRPKMQPHSSTIASACVVSSIQQAFNPIKNATPAPEMRSGIQPPRQKLRLVISSIQQAYTHVKNATPPPEMPSKKQPLHQK